MVLVDQAQGQSVFADENWDTLVEILVATTLSLLLLGAVITMFGKVSESITDSRSMLETADRLRLAEERLQLDLAGDDRHDEPSARSRQQRGLFRVHRRAGRRRDPTMPDRPYAP